MQELTLLDFTGLHTRPATGGITVTPADVNKCSLSSQRPYCLCPQCETFCRSHNTCAPAHAEHTEVIQHHRPNLHPRHRCWETSPHWRSLKLSYAVLNNICICCWLYSQTQQMLIQLCLQVALHRTYLFQCGFEPMSSVHVIYETGF